VPQGEGAVCGVVCAIGLLVLMAYFKEKCTRLVREKLTVFSYGQYVVGIYVSSVF